MSIAVGRLTRERKKAPGTDHFTIEIVKTGYNARKAACPFQQVPLRAFFSKAMEGWKAGAHTEDRVEVQADNLTLKLREAL